MDADDGLNKALVGIVMTQKRGGVMATVRLASESIYSSERLVVPLADVQHVEKQKNGGLIVVTKHTRWDNETGAYANHVWVDDAEKTAFLQAWCYYRGEIDPVKGGP